MYPSSCKAHAIFNSGRWIFRNLNRSVTDVSFVLLWVSNANAAIRFGPSIDKVKILVLIDIFFPSFCYSSPIQSGSCFWDHRWQALLVWVLCLDRSCPHSESEHLPLPSLPFSAHFEISNRLPPHWRILLRKKKGNLHNPTPRRLHTNLIPGIPFFLLGAPS